MAKKAVKCAPAEPPVWMRQCVDTHGMEVKAEWATSSISLQAQFWSCGMVARESANTSHDHEPEEVKRCRALSKAAAKVIGPEWPLTGSGSDPGTEPFFVVAQKGAHVPGRVTEKLVRAVLGGTLHPDARVVIEPLNKKTEWWKEIERSARAWAERDDPKDRAIGDAGLRAWEALIHWFPAHDLAAPAFVRVTDHVGSTETSHTLGCVYPCFLVGVTDKGSLVGVATFVVE